MDLNESEKRQEILQAADLTRTYLQLLDPNVVSNNEARANRVRQVKTLRKAMLKDFAEDHSKHKKDWLVNNLKDKGIPQTLIHLISESEDIVTYITTIILMGHELGKAGGGLDDINHFAADITNVSIIEGTLNIEESPIKVKQAVIVVRELLGMDSSLSRVKLD